jgi:hypothetical protein
MSESLHDSASHEKDHTNDGLVEIGYQDRHYITLQMAETVDASVRFEDKVVHYEKLVTKDNYILEPHTAFLHEGFNTFGSSLELAYSADGQVILQTKERSTNLGFMAIVQTLGPKHIEKLVQKIEDEQSYDIIKHLVRVDELKNHNYVLWLRLEPRQAFRVPATQPVVAQLDSIQLASDGWTMVPMITDVNGQTDRVPESFTLGRPWLYISANNNFEPDEE